VAGSKSGRTFAGDGSITLYRQNPGELSEVDEETAEFVREGTGSSEGSFSIGDIAPMPTKSQRTSAEKLFAVSDRRVIPQLIVEHTDAVLRKTLQQLRSRGEAHDV
jgi:hypothetical protein